MKTLPLFSTTFLFSAIILHKLTLVRGSQLNVKRQIKVTYK